MGLEKRGLIIHCNCSGLSSFIRTQFALRFPDAPFPPTYKQTQLTSLFLTLPPSSPVSQFIGQYRHKRGRFAIYLDTTEDGQITQAFNLLTGRPLV